MRTVAMATSQRWRQLVLSSLVGAAFACADPATTPAARAPAPPAEGVERYLPLPEGFVYQYDIETDTGETGRMMMHVSRPRAGMAELEVAGKVQRLEVSADAVQHATGGYLLKAPLDLGAEWKGQFGTVRVASVTRSVQTPAGAFQACVETVEEATTPPKRATSIYCLDVGLVRLHIEGEQGDEAVSVETTLRSYGPRPPEFQ